MTLLRELKSVTGRARGTLVQDTLGVASLVLMLVIGLHLPGLV